MICLKAFQYFIRMQSTDSLERSSMLGKIERREGWQRMRWLMISHWLKDMLGVGSRAMITVMPQSMGNSRWSQLTELKGFGDQLIFLIQIALATKMCKKEKFIQVEVERQRLICHNNCHSEQTSSDSWKSHDSLLRLPTSFPQYGLKFLLCLRWLHVTHHSCKTPYSKLSVESDYFRGSGSLFI